MEGFRSLMRLKGLQSFGLALLFFVIGVLLALYLEDALRRIMINVYVIATNGNLYFSGKYFFFLDGLWFYFLSGLSLSFLALHSQGHAINRIIGTALIWILVFDLMFVTLSAFHANLLWIQCTNCTDNALTLRFQDAALEPILSVSVLIADLAILGLAWWRNRL